MGVVEKDLRPQLLLHSCCGPCSTSVIERLAERFSITIFFYNPNITDGKEYEKRKETQIYFLNKYNNGIEEEKKIKFLPGDYDARVFFEIIKGTEREPEGGARCERCFRLRLGETAKKAKELEFDLFATTLSVSPHKNYSLLAALGEEAASNVRIPFLAEDFKKKAGYQRSVALSREYELYRQNYCGCEFSKHR